MAAISIIFSGAVYKINAAAIDKVRAVQTLATHNASVAARNGRKIQANCRFDINAINEAHDSIKAGFKREAAIAQSNIDAIDYGIKHNLIPDSLVAYYAAARQRQIENRDHFHTLANSVESLTPIC